MILAQCIRKPDSSAFCVLGRLCKFYSLVFHQQLRRHGSTFCNVEFYLNQWNVRAVKPHYNTIALFKVFHGVHTSLQGANSPDFVKCRTWRTQFLAQRTSFH